MKENIDVDVLDRLQFEYNLMKIIIITSKEKSSTKDDRELRDDNPNM